MKKVLLLGMGTTALSALQSLAQQFHVVGIVRDAPRGAERDDPVVRRAHELSVPVLPDVSLSAVLDAIQRERPDCTVVSSYDRILNAGILVHGRFVNVHYAALPRYRGRANVNWAIINREPETAITIHTMAPGVDAGNILFQQTAEIGPDDTVGKVYDKLNEIQQKVLAGTVARHIDGFTGALQDEFESSYGCTRVPGDGEIDWSESTDHIYALIRALSPPYPGAYSYIDARQVIIARASPLKDGPRYVGRIPGRVVGRSGREGHVDILTGDGILRIHDVIVAEDEEMVPASRVVTSTRQTLGLRSSELLARIDMLERRLNALTQG